MREGYAELGTVRLHYVEQGEGPLVVLLHGFPEFWYGWRHQIGPLAEAGFRVVAPDMRGYNLSSKPRGRDQYDVALLAQDVAELIEERGETQGARRRPRLGRRRGLGDRGLSPRGGGAARDPQRAPPARVHRAPQGPAPARALLVHGLLPAPLPPRAAREAAPSPARFPEDERARYEEAYAQPGALTAMLNYYRALSRDTPRSAERRIRTVHAPTRVIWGERDRYLGPGLAEPHRADVPNLERVIRLDTSHWVQHEAPDEVAALLVEFFSLT